MGVAKKKSTHCESSRRADVYDFFTGRLFDNLRQLVGIVAYSIQIYFDFSDMAISLGKVMGFNFPENFKNPYTAQGITDSWRRWHLMLGTLAWLFIHPLRWEQICSWVPQLFEFSHRIFTLWALARIFMEFCDLGSLAWRFSHSRKSLFAKVVTENTCSLKAWIHLPCSSL